MNIRLVHVLVGTASFALAWHGWTYLESEPGELALLPYMVVAFLGGAVIGSRWAALIVPVVGLLPIVLQEWTTQEPENVRPSEFPPGFEVFLGAVVFAIVGLLAWAGFVTGRLLMVVVGAVRARRSAHADAIVGNRTQLGLEDVAHESRLLLGGFAISLAVTLAVFLLFAYLPHSFVSVTPNR